MEIGLLINGRLCNSPEKIVVTNPASGEVVGTVPFCTKQEAREAVEAAQNAFFIWSKTSPKQRSEVLRKAADIVRSSSERLAVLLTQEQGKPLNDSRKEIAGAAEVLDYYSQVAVDVVGEISCPAGANTRSLVFKEPVGVVAAITPWNYPVSLVAWKLAPALAAGCTVIIKPPRLTPLAVAEFIRLCHSAGLPDGAVNVVVGSHSEVGQELLGNTIIKKIAFTGSTETGREIMKACVPTLKRLNLELGGHSPLIIFEDADFTQAVKDGVKRSFRNMGQICNAVNRIYVHESIADQYIRAFVEQTKKLTIGDGLANPGIDLGPMVDEAGLKKAEEHIRDALEKGAVLECGGKRPSAPELAKGNFFEPAVLTKVSADMKVMQEETFGPVVAIDTFSTLEEVIRKANNNPYGLVSYVYTANLHTAFRVSEALDCGNVAINTVSPDSIYAPYSGRKDSGFGVELSKHGMEQFLQFKHVRIELS